MLKNEREQEILTMLQGNGYLTVRQLSEMLYTSESTVRRTLAALEQDGCIKRSYGGAEPLAKTSYAPSFNTRSHQNPEAKRIIARKAAQLVSDGSIIFLDQSSTAFYLAQELLCKQDLTVMTNNLEILALLSQTDFTVFSTGGRLSTRNRTCLIDAEAERAFAGIYAELAFFSTKSLSTDGVISDFNRDEIAVRNAMLRNADKKVYLCDSTKFHTRSPYRQCSLEDVDYMVCEVPVTEKYGEKFPHLLLL